MIEFNKYKNIITAERVTIHDIAMHVKRDQIDFDEHGNVFVGFNKGNAGSMILVAHMDNVLHGKREPVMTVDGKYILGRSAGIGWDDKAGIIANLELYNRLKGKVRIIFTTDEEVGGISAGKLDPSRYKDAKFMIELDRRNGHDLIQNSGSTRLCSDKFAAMIEAYGFIKATGTFTDVNRFKEKMPTIEMCNLSIGYYNAHSNEEYLDIKEFNDIVDTVQKIITNLTGDYIDDQKDIQPMYNYDRYDYSYRRLQDFDDDEDELDEILYCDNCGMPIKGKGIQTKEGWLCCCKQCKHELEDYMDGTLENKQEDK